MQTDLLELGIVGAPTTGSSWATSLRRGGSALLLAGLFGAAVGARYGASSALLHGLGVPLAFAAVALVVLPSLFVALGYANIVIEPLTAAELCSRALLAGGGLLAGLSPAALMLAISVEQDSSAAAITWLALLTAGGMTLRRLIGGLDRSADDDAFAPLLARRILLLSFLLVASVTALRIWWLALPMLGGGR